MGFSILISRRKLNYQKFFSFLIFIKLLPSLYQKQELKYLKADNISSKHNCQVTSIISYIIIIPKKFIWHQFYNNIMLNNHLKFPQEKQLSQSNSACKLLGKDNEYITFDEDALAIKCIKDSSHHISVRTNQVLPQQTYLLYFQLLILMKRQNTHDIYIGLCSKDLGHKKCPGTISKSVGFNGNSIYFMRNQQKKQPTNIKLQLSKKNIGMSSVLGIGVDLVNQSIFVTVNGQKIECTCPLQENWNQFYGCVSVKNASESVYVILNPKKYLFNYKKLEEQLSQQVKRQSMQLIGNQEKDHILYLVAQYLQFYGYKKTMQNFRQSFPQIPKINWSRNPSMKPVINLQGEQAQKQYPSDFQYLSDKSIEKDQQIQIPVVFRKGTQQIVDQVYRKYSNISNISNYEESESNNNIENQEQQVVKQIHFQNISKLKNSLQNFLKKDRLQILGFIQQLKFELAFKIINQKLPKILQTDPYLQAYFKTHIFIRKIKTESILEAINYAKQSKNVLAPYFDHLFPYYDLKKMKGNSVPLKQVFTLVKGTTENNKHFLEQSQFNYFAEYTNSIILKRLGFYSESKLEVILAHFAQLQASLESTAIVHPNISHFFE